MADCEEHWARIKWSDLVWHFFLWCLTPITWAAQVFDHWPQGKQSWAEPDEQRRRWLSRDKDQE